MKIEDDAGWVKVEPDLTDLKTPFGLLDRKTQEALKAHGGPYELWRGSLWGDVDPHDDFDSWYSYRVKPAPPKPREFWLRFDMNGNAPIVYGTETEPVTPDGFVVHVREVLPE